MKLFKKSTMSVALTAVMAGGTLMGLSAPASAVNIAHDGLGDAMVFPYYTVNEGWSTFFNLTNTSDRTVVIKVRWREAHNSRDVRDFNVILSPFDVWTAATVPVDGGGAGMITSDNSCTFPELQPRGNGLTGIDFTNAAYTGSDADTGPTSISRANEGYFEVFEMGTIDNETATGVTAIVATNAEHGPAAASNNTAVPLNCDVVRSVLRDDSVDFQNNLLPNQNNLKGRAVLINSANGVAAGYDPQVFANFNTIVPNYQAPAQTTPNWAEAQPPVGTFIEDNTGAPVTTVVVNSPADPVSGIIARTAVINDYNVATGSETDWVLTFPTKNFYVDGRNTFNSANFNNPLAASLPPFDAASVGGELFGATPASLGESCFTVNVNLWDREEFSSFTPTVDSFSPVQPGFTPRAELCYEANILSFGESNLFGSQVRAVQGGLPGDNGWAEVTFGDGEAALPVVGMRVEQRNQGNATVNFGFANTHAYRRGVQTTPLARSAN